jgi:peptidase E
LVCRWILPKLLDEGALYVGSSAGSMITSKTLELAEWYIGEEERGSSLIPGLGLIDFEIYPHYEESLLPQIKSKFKGKDLYLLKNGEAILIEDNNIKVFGEERTIKN